MTVIEFESGFLCVCLLLFLRTEEVLMHTILDADTLNKQLDCLRFRDRVARREIKTVKVSWENISAVCC